jgi:DNA-binding NtrC family response regulator
MPIALIAHDEPLLGEVGDRLVSAGANDVYCVTDNELLRGSKSIEGADLILLIQTAHDKLRAGESVDQIRRMMGRGQRLVLCMPRTREFDFFRRRGADDIINPVVPDASRIAERILGHLILAKRIEPYGLEKMLGATPSMRELYRRIKKIAKRDESVLILGETGTGKELVADALHSLSGRRGKLIKITCSEFSADMIGSELFGHRKGSFTGADRERPGMIKGAEGGTVFIDEIGELEKSVQVKLLDAVQWARVRPVGSDDTESVDVRFVFATNADLQKLISGGSFRRDFFERINVHMLRPPPLRERMADIPLLVKHFVSKLKGSSLRLKDGAVDVLFRHEWPNNVRELENVVKRASVDAEADGAISDLMLLESITKQEVRRGNYIEFDPRTETWPKLRDRTEAEYFRALDDIEGTSEDRITLSGMERSQYFEIRKKHGLGRGKHF